MTCLSRRLRLSANLGSYSKRTLAAALSQTQNLHNLTMSCHKRKGRHLRGKNLKNRYLTRMQFPSSQSSGTGEADMSIKCKCLTNRVQVCSDAVSVYVPRITWNHCGGERREDWGIQRSRFFFINKKQERRNERESEQCGLCLIFFCIRRKSLSFPSRNLRCFMAPRKEWQWSVTERIKPVMAKKKNMTLPNSDTGAKTWQV